MMDLSSIYIANDATSVWTNGITIGKVESIGNPAGIGQGTGFGLRERDRDGIGLGLSRLRTTNIISRILFLLMPLLVMMDNFTKG